MQQQQSAVIVSTLESKFILVQSHVIYHKDTRLG
jgi:hypothetical protein